MGNYANKYCIYNQVNFVSNTKININLVLQYWFKCLRWFVWISKLKHPSSYMEISSRNIVLPTANIDTVSPRLHNVSESTWWSTANIGYTDMCTCDSIRYQALPQSTRYTAWRYWAGIIIMLDLDYDDWSSTGRSRSSDCLIARGVWIIKMLAQLRSY